MSAPMKYPSVGYVFLRSGLLAMALTAATAARAAKTNAATGRASAAAPTPTSTAAADTNAYAAVTENLTDEGYLELRVGNYDAALDRFAEALRRNTTHKRALFGLGTALISLNRHADAARVLTPLAQRYPDDYFTLNNLAWLYATTPDPRLRDGARATDLALRALTLAPNDYHVWSSLSEAHFISGNYERAIHAAEWAVTLAQQTGDPNRVQEYLQQLEKCRQAALAAKILE